MLISIISIIQPTHQGGRSKQRRGRLWGVLLEGMLLLLLCSACATAGNTQVPSSYAMHATVDSQQTPAIDWQPVEKAMGRTGTSQAGGVYKFSFPRTDLHVTIGEITVKAGLALGSHVEFFPMGKAAMMMGDLVLTEDEVNSVILALQQGGVQQTALHNHLLHETPRVLYMHIGGQGDPVHLATVIHDALAHTRTPLTASPGTQQTSSLDLPTSQLDTILRSHGKANNGIYQYSIARKEKISDAGMTIPPAMGVATALNFQPTGDGKAAITGDFVLLASEVNPVIKALGDNGIEVTAVHSHMLTESPHLFYLHFWAHADAIGLAHGLRAALDTTNSITPAG